MNLSVVETINLRFDHLMLDVATVSEQLGIETPGSVKFEHTEQSNARRELLRVEKIAIRDKELNKKSEQNFVDSIRDMVHEEVNTRLLAALEDSDHLLNKVLGYNAGLAEILDILSVKASTISRIEPVATEVPWLYDELIKLVNTSEFRRTDSRGKAIAVDTLRSALSIIGIGNLRQIIPYMAFRRWIPQITDPFPQIKVKLAEEALAVAISARTIGELNKVDPDQAFTLGMMHDIGRIILTRLYFRLFEQVQREALIEAHEERKREEHTALQKIVPSGEFLIGLIKKHGLSISANLIKEMGFKRLFIANAMEEVANGATLAEMSPIGKTLYQAKAYAKYRMLKGHKLISMEEAKAYLLQFSLPTGALSALKTTDLRKMRFKREEA